MKIKTVCDVTGLTDRTIRYYIEEQLISPAYTENYLGRKSFDFTQENIEELKNISILRKFDFTIHEIRRIIEDVNASTSIIASVMHRTEEAVSVGEEKLLALSRLSSEYTYTLEQLAEELSRPAITLPKHIEHIKWDPVKIIKSLIKSILLFLIVWSPMMLSLFVVMVSVNDYHYPVFNYTMLGLTIASFWPSIGVFIVSKTKWKWKKRASRILLILCVLSIPTSFLMSLGIITKSETSDIRNYRRLDADCLANRYAFYQELFPTWPHYFVNEQQPDGSWETAYLDAHYYYCNRSAFDYTYDIYAEWPLEKEEFENEVSRAQALFESQATEYNRKYEIMQKGSYTCLIAYNGNSPFEAVTDSYTYYIFAYDKSNLVVRYILCDSLENGSDQPYYLTLDW